MRYAPLITLWLFAACERTTVDPLVGAHRFATRPVPLTSLRQDAHRITIDDASTQGRYEALELGLTRATVSLTSRHAQVRTTALHSTFSGGVLMNRAAVFRSADAILVLTPEADGVKEELVLPRQNGEQLTLEWAVELSDGLTVNRKGHALEVRSIDGHVHFEWPAPLLRDASGKETSDGLRLDFEPGRLKLTARGLDRLTYPVSIDPTVRVASDDDWSTQSTFDRVTSSNSGIVREASMGALQGTWQPRAPMLRARARHGSVTVGRCALAVGGDDASGAAQASVETNCAGAGWQLGLDLPSARRLHGVTSAGGYVYVLGGEDSTSTPTNQVWFSRVALDGTMGPWVATTPLPTARAGLTAFVIDGALYAAGGRDSTQSSELLKASLLADGRVGAWVVAGALATPVEQHVTVVTSGFVFVLGGLTATGPTNQVWGARMSADGTLGPWASMAPLPQVVRQAGGTAGAGTLFIGGGVTSTGINPELWRANVSPRGVVSWSAMALPAARSGLTLEWAPGVLTALGGSDMSGVAQPNTTAQQFAATPQDHSLRPWSGGPSFSIARWGHASVLADGYLYLLGGSTTSTGAPITADVQMATLAPDGTLGAFAAVTPLPTGAQLLTAEGWNHRIYAVGGNGVGLSTYVSDIGDGGALSAWRFAGATLPTSRFAHSSAIANGVLYVIGGTNGAALSDVLVAHVNADGTLAPFVASTPITPPRYYAASVVHDGMLYVAGGASTSMYSSFLDDVQAAPLDGDGGVGPWQLVTRLTRGRAYHGLAATNGALYVTGGYEQTPLSDGGSAGNFLGLVEMAPITGPGTLGPWVTMAPLNPIRAYGTLRALDGQLYVAGGYWGPMLSDTQVTTVSGALARGAITRLVDFGVQTQIDALTVAASSTARGTIQLAWRNADDAGVMSPLVDVGPVTPGQSLPINRTTRAMWVRLTLDDVATTDSTSTVPRDVTSLEFATKGLVGATCSSGADCANGLCVDQVCCESACAGSCEACNLAGQTGHCAAVDAGTLASPSCAPYVCDGVSGGCPTSCRDGSACVSNAVCSMSSCVTLKNAGDTCNDSATCLSGLCLAGLCDVLRPLGESCSLAANCTSGQCVSGRCCDRACDDPCESCEEPGVEGTCVVRRSDTFNCTKPVDDQMLATQPVHRTLKVSCSSVSPDIAPLWVAWVLLRRRHRR